MIERYEGHDEYCIVRNGYGICNCENLRAYKAAKENTVSDKQVCKCGREDLTGVAVRHIGGGGWHTKESCELPTPPVPSEDAREWTRRPISSGDDGITPRNEARKFAICQKQFGVGFVDAYPNADVYEFAAVYAAHVASRAAHCRCPEGVCLLHPNSPGYEKKCSFKNPAAQPDTRKLAEKNLLQALKEFRETAGYHEGDHDSSLTVCAKCNESYVLAEAKLDAVVELILLDGGKQ